MRRPAAVSCDPGEERSKETDDVVVQPARRKSCNLVSSGNQETQLFEVGRMSGRFSRQKAIRDGMLWVWLGNRT